MRTVSLADIMANGVAYYERQILSHSLDVNIQYTPEQLSEHAQMLATSLRSGSLHTLIEHVGRGGQARITLKIPDSAGDLKKTGAAMLPEAYRPFLRVARDHGLVVRVSHRQLVGAIFIEIGVSRECLQDHGVTAPNLGLQGDGQ